MPFGLWVERQADAATGGVDEDAVAGLHVAEVDEHESGGDVGDGEAGRGVQVEGGWDGEGLDGRDGDAVGVATDVARSKSLERLGLVR